MQCDVMWEQYALALETPSATAVQTFTDYVMKRICPADGESDDTPAKKKKNQKRQQRQKLNTIGKELVLPMAELNTSHQNQHPNDHSTKVRLLQLQVICRIFCYCGMTNATSLEKRAMKKEIRTILDRIALLLDAVNPPSLIDDDDRSPFHEFLHDVLSKQLQSMVPALFKYLWKAYELEDDTEEPDQRPNLLSKLVPMVKPEQQEQPPSSPKKHSILSALRDERPLKRPRQEIDDQFKEVLLFSRNLNQRKSHMSSRMDGELLQKSNRTGALKASRTSSSKSASASKSGDRRREKHSSSSTSAKSTHKARHTSHKPLGGPTKTTPLLVTQIDRSAHRSASHSAKQPLLGGMNAPIPLTVRKLTNPPISASKPQRITSLSKNAIVMRTPDRPQRLPRRNARILVESSPPLRNTRVSAHLLQKKPSGIPPPMLG